MRVHRCFAFVDMCGFTRMNDTLGDDEAVAVLSSFRALVRRLAPDHGYRPLKSSGRTAADVLAEVGAVATDWVRVLPR